MPEYIIVEKPRKRRHERKLDLPGIDELYRTKVEELEELEKIRKEFADKNKPKPQGHKFTFTEGLLLAFLFQYTIGPMISAALKAQGLQ